VKTVIKAGIVFAAVLFAAFVGFGVYKYKTGSSMEADAALNEAVLQDDWQLRNISGTGIQVLAPSALQAFETEAAEGVSDQKLYMYNKGGSFALTIITFETDNGTVDAERYTETLAKSVKDSKTTSRYKYTIDPVNINGRNGFLLTGTANSKGMKIRVDGLTFAEGSRLWHISSSYDEENPKLMKLVEQVFNSMKIVE
jgi:hypothetical protein